MKGHKAMTLYQPVIDQTLANQTQSAGTLAVPARLPRSEILCGDAKALLREMPSESVDMVLTDAPYLVNYQSRDGRAVRNDNNPEAVLSVFPELYRVLKHNSYCLVFCGWSNIADFALSWKEAGFRIAGHIVWAKDYASNARHVAYKHESAYVLVKGEPQRPEKPPSDVQSWVYTGNKLHPTEKVVEILTPLVCAFSKPGDLILDPFAGSGSSAVAANLCGRNAIGIEVEENHCETAKRRLDGVARYLEQNT